MRLMRVQFQGTEYSIKKNLFALKLAKIANCPAVMLNYDVPMIDWLPPEKITRNYFADCFKGEVPDDIEGFIDKAVSQFGRKKERRDLLFNLVDRKDCFQIHLPDNIFYLRKWRFLQTLAYLPGVSTDMSNEEIADLAVTVMDMDELKKCIRGNIPQNTRTLLQIGINQILEDEKLRTRLNNLIQNASQGKANLEIFEKTFTVEFQGEEFQVMQGLYHELGNIDDVSEETTDEEFIRLSTQIQKKDLEYLICGKKPNDLKEFVKVATKIFLEDNGRRELLTERVRRIEELKRATHEAVEDMRDLLEGFDFDDFNDEQQS